MLRDGRRRCARCRFDWKPGRLPLRLSRGEWRMLISWFVREAPSAEIAYETGLERKRVLRALTVLREAIWRSSRDRRREGRGRAHAFLRQRASPTPRRFALIGIFLAHGDVGAETISSREFEQLVATYGERRDQHAAPDALEHYVAVVVRGRLHRLSRRGEGRAPFGQIEGFWAYVQRHLRTKGGIRPSRLNLYLAEFAWRYNHRKLSPPEQVSQLMMLVRRYSRWPEWDSPAGPHMRDGPMIYPSATRGHN